jgi:hypothetical protein
MPIAPLSNTLHQASLPHNKTQGARTPRHETILCGGGARNLKVRKSNRATGHLNWICLFTDQTVYAAQAQYFAECFRF